MKTILKEEEQKNKAKWFKVAYLSDNDKIEAEFTSAWPIIGKRAESLVVKAKDLDISKEEMDKFLAELKNANEFANGIRYDIFTGKENMRISLAVPSLFTMLKLKREGFDFSIFDSIKEKTLGLSTTVEEMLVTPKISKKN